MLFKGFPASATFENVFKEGPLIYAVVSLKVLNQTFKLNYTFEERKDGVYVVFIGGQAFGQDVFKKFNKKISEETKKELYKHLNLTREDQKL